jgi:mannosyltransferase
VNQSAATLPASPAAVGGGATRDGAPPEARSRRLAALAWVVALTAAGAAIRFIPLGVQSFHHDEVITVMRVIPGSFGHMLHEVRVSESNPPLYYALAWGWAKVFGTGEVGIRSLSALVGALTVPLGYPIGRQLSGRRAGLLLTALLAVNPMLIWYSQEARSYALLVLFGALSFLFFVRALDSRRGLDLGLWALTSALALGSHYFAFFAVGVEAAWLAVALRDRWRALLPALALVAAAGAALLPLIAAQVNPNHIGWIEQTSLPARLFQTAVSFLIGETGHVIAEPPRPHYAVLPVIVLGLGAALLLFRGSRRERRGGARGLLVGLGVVALAAAAALVGKDYVIERNLLPALVPLCAVAALGFATRRARWVGLLLAVVVCAYWAVFDVYVTQTPNLQRPDYRTLTRELGPARVPRAIVSWRLAADPVLWYLSGHPLRWYGGPERVREIDVIGKPSAAGRPANLPHSFHSAGVVHKDRLILSRYISSRPMKIWIRQLKRVPTGYGADAVVLDGPSGYRQLGRLAKTAPAAAITTRRAATQ